MKKFTYLLILFPTLIFSQIAFDGEKILFDESHYNSKIVATVIKDIDNDGDKDVIAASYNDNSVLMYENINGDLLHNPRILITSNAERPGDLKVSDLDNDGLEDIIVTSNRGNKIIWFKNLGANTFSQEIILIDNFNRPKKIVCIDIDNDGDNDVVFNSSQDDNVFLLKNDGNGNFANLQVVMTINDDGEVLDAVDIDNDGLFDIVASNWSDEFYWVKNLGNGLFAGEQLVGYGSDLEFFDLNNDNFLDAIAVDDYNDTVHYYLNQGGGSFGNSNTISIVYDWPTELEIADMDNDGIPDIVVTFNYNNGRIGWFKNNGNETFGNLNVITTNVKSPRVLRLGDIDDDGRNDVIFRDDNLSYKFSWYKNIDGFNFEENVINFYLQTIRCVRVADINNDGKNDIIVGQNKITWCENYGNNTFSAPRLLSHSNPVENSPATYDIEILDIDNDNDLDIIALIEKQIDIYENLGNGKFKLQLSIPFSHHTERGREIEIGDLDGDGIFDIAVTLIYSGIDNKMGWFKNLGNNTFTPFIPLNFTGQYDFRPFDLKLGDIDNDGDIDIVTSTPDDARTNTLKNDGAGNFTLSTPNRFVATRKLILDDVDNDGDPDIITSGYGDWGIYRQTNTNGFFGATINIDDLQRADDIFFEDINNDGLKDVIGSSANYSSSENLIFYYLNNGSSFGPKTIIDSKNYDYTSPKYLYVSDINNDNKKDVIVGQYWPNQRLIYYSNESILGIDNNHVAVNKENIFYPNPVTNILNWKIPNPENFYDIDILNTRGAIIFSATDYEGSSLSLSFLNAGMYFIRLSSNSQSLVKRIVKK